MPVNEESRQTTLLPVQNYTDRIIISDGGRVEDQGGASFEDDFLGDLIADQYAANADGGGASAIVAAVGGTVGITTAATNDNKSELTAELNWAASKSVIFEARVTVDAITTVNFEVGLNDAKTEGATTLPFSDNDTPTAVATNAVMVGFDTDASTNTNLTALVVKAGVAQALDLGVAPVAATYNIIRIETNTDGDADFFVDGVYKGSLADAVTAATALTPYMGVQNRTTVITRKLTVDYLHLYQDR